MYTTTVAKAIAANVNDDVIEGHEIYIVRENDHIFYIGRSIHPLERLQEHLGKTGQSWFPSSLGRFILDYPLDAQGWIYDLLKAEECKEYVDSFRQHYQTHEWKYPLTHLVDEAEARLIRHFHPCLNSAGNNDPLPLPEKYRQDRIINANIKLTNIDDD